MSYKCDNCGDVDDEFLCSGCVSEKEDMAREEGREEIRELHKE